MIFGKFFARTWNIRCLVDESFVPANRLIGCEIQYHTFRTYIQKFSGNPKIVFSMYI